MNTKNESAQAVRKVVSYATMNGAWHAVCDDGSMWVLRGSGSRARWIRMESDMPPIPQSDSDANDLRPNDAPGQLLY